MRNSKQRQLRQQKLTLFTEKQAQLLSELTRNQVRLIRKKQLINPITEPAILYNWNQVIFLRMICELRQHWTIQEIETIFQTQVPLHNFINNITHLSIIALTTDSTDQLNFHAFAGAGSQKSFGDYFTMMFSTSPNPSPNPPSSISSKKQTIILIPELIKKLKARAFQSAAITHLNLKIPQQWETTRSAELSLPHS